MTPVYIDLHIHTSEDPNSLNKSYDIDLLDRNIKKFNGNSDYLISLTDHNTINEEVYLKALNKGINIIVGVELHIKNYEECPAYHCHIYFNLDKIDKSVLSDINKKLDILYPNKVVNKADKSIPKLERIINLFDSYDFLLLPHGGQSHCTFDTSIPAGVKFDTTMERSIYYNQFDGFTARGNTGLEKLKVISPNWALMTLSILLLVRIITFLGTIQMLRQKMHNHSFLHGCLLNRLSTD